jgi:hypothetical protein
MRSIGAALLLSILFFNWFGYRLVIALLETQANSQLEAQFDQKVFDDAQLISIKVPVRYLPYYTNSFQYERVDGQIEVGGVQYKYVKRRIYNDSLELLCIPNHTAMRLRTAENEFFKFSNDLTREKKSGDNSHGRKHFSLHHFTVQAASRLIAPFRIVTEHPASPVSLLPLRRHVPAEQPPERA